MFIIDFLPFWVFHILVFAGIAAVVASFFFKFIPLINQYSLPIQILGIAAISAGVFFEGAISNEEKWIAKVREEEAKVAAVEVKSAEENTKIITKYVERVHIVRETTDAIIKEIPIYITKDDDRKCELSNAAIVLHNSASQNNLPPSPSSITPGPSDVKASELLTTVTENYGTCYEIREQLKAWQDWYKTQKKIYETITK
jgi:hypothetical protein